jgi:uncharacterized RDD family membrane protein YckC
VPLPRLPTGSTSNPSNPSMPVARPATASGPARPSTGSLQTPQVPLAPPGGGTGRATPASPVTAVVRPASQPHPSPSQLASILERKADAAREPAEKKRLLMQVASLQTDPDQRYLAVAQAYRVDPSDLLIRAALERAASTEESKLLLQYLMAELNPAPKATVTVAPEPPPQPQPQPDPAPAPKPPSLPPRQPEPTLPPSRPAPELPPQPSTPEPDFPQSPADEPPPGLSARAPAQALLQAVPAQPIAPRPLAFTPGVSIPDAFPREPARAPEVTGEVDISFETGPIQVSKPALQARPPVQAQRTPTPVPMPRAPTPVPVPAAVQAPIQAQAPRLPVPAPEPVAAPEPIPAPIQAKLPEPVPAPVEAKPELKAEAKPETKPETKPKVEAKKPAKGRRIDGQLIKATPASIFVRMAAWAVDGAILAAALAIYIKVAQVVMHHPPPPTTETGLDWLVNRVDAYQVVLKYGLGLSAAMAFVYSALSHSLGGMTLGMRLFGVRLVDVTGKPPSLGRCAVRAALSVVSFGALFLGFIWALFDRRRQALHDKMTSTFVVKLLAPKTAARGN